MQRLGLALLAILACGSACAQAPGGPPPAVTVSAPLKHDVTEWLEYTGQFAAVDSVEIRARVSGYLTEVRSRTASSSSKGDLLFLIDPRPFEIELQRPRHSATPPPRSSSSPPATCPAGAALRQSDDLAASTYDQRVQQMKTATAALAPPTPRSGTAQLDLEYSHVTAPWPGASAARRSRVGNLVVGGVNATTRPC